MPADLTPEGDGVESDLAPDEVFWMLVHVADTSDVEMGTWRWGRGDGDVEMGMTLRVHGLMVTG